MLKFSFREVNKKNHIPSRVAIQQIIYFSSCFQWFPRLCLYQLICVCLYMHACVLLTHASSTSHLRHIWFPSEARGAAAARPLRVQQFYPLTHKSMVRGPLPVIQTDPMASSQTSQDHPPLSLFYCPWNEVCSKFYLLLCFIPEFILKLAHRKRTPWGWVTFSLAALFFLFSPKPQAAAMASWRWALLSVLRLLWV